MNLIDSISTLLQRIPLAVRQWVYSLGALAASVYAIWEASNGDWETFWKAMVAASISVIARGNANGGGSDGPDGTEPDEENIDGETFDETVLPGE